MSYKGESENTKVDPDLDPDPKSLNERWETLHHIETLHVRKFQVNRSSSLGGVARKRKMQKKNNNKNN